MVRVGFYGHLPDGETPADKIQGLFQFIHENSRRSPAYINASKVIALIPVKTNFPPEGGKIIPAPPLFKNKPVEGTVRAKAFTEWDMEIKETWLTRLRGGQRRRLPFLKAHDPGKVPTGHITY